MKHGFKAQAERIALDLRGKLGLSVSNPLMGNVLAKRLEVRVLSAARIPAIPPEVKAQLWELDRSSWSAFTIAHDTKGTYIFYNPTHSRGRHESNVMHEMSHLICSHKPSRFVEFEDCGYSLRTCNPECEEEADWMGGCLKLPRESLVWAVRRGMTNADIAAHFQTTEDIVRYRRNKAGIDRQFQHRRKN